MARRKKTEKRELSHEDIPRIPLAVGMGIDRLVDAIRAFDGSAGVVETAAGALGLPVLLVAAAALFSSLMSYVQQYIIATVGEELTLSLTEAGVEHVVIRDDAASYFE